MAGVSPELGDTLDPGDPWLSHSSRDCDTAREAISAVIDKWKVPDDIATQSAAAYSIGTPDDGSLPTGPILGAASSDKLRDPASR